MRFFNNLPALLIVIICCSIFAVGCVGPGSNPEASTKNVDLAVTTLASNTALSTRPSTTVPATTNPVMSDTPTNAPTTPDQTLSPKANADVIFVIAKQTAEDTWQFAVTVEHPDTGWEDYADGWNVVLPDGTVLKPDPDSPFTRLLLHPHENEQPFTRSQSGIIIEPDITLVTVRAHDLVDGFGGREVVVDLTQEAGQYYEVKRLSE